MTARPGAEQLLRAAVAGLPQAVHRAGQVTMAAAVARAGGSGEHLLVQAGTGTGKSLAYLAGVLAVGRRAVVATATLALQAQLVRADAPRMLDAAAPLLGRRPSSALLKGRANYLCLLQLNAGGDAAAPTLDEVAPAAGSRASASSSAGSGSGPSRPPPATGTSWTGPRRTRCGGRRR